MNPLRRIKETRRKAAEADLLLDERIAETQAVYNALFRTLLRTQEELSVQRHARYRREAGLHGT